MAALKNHWPKLALILAYILATYVFIQVDHDDIGVTDIYIFNRFSITYLYDVNEGPVFWLYDGKHF